MGRGEEAERPVFRGGVVETSDQCGLERVEWHCIFASLHLAYIIAYCMYIESAMSICMVLERILHGVRQLLY